VRPPSGNRLTALGCTTFVVVWVGSAIAWLGAASAGFSTGTCSDTSLPSQCDSQQRGATIFAIIVGLVLAACLVAVIAWLVRRFLGTARIGRPGIILAGLAIAPMPTVATMVGLTAGGGFVELTLATAAMWTVAWAYGLGRVGWEQRSPA
jgi:hypothetical protein